MANLLAVLSTDSAPAWVQAIGTLVALGVAIWVVWFQHHLAAGDEFRKQQRADFEKRQRLVAALRAEIEAATEAAERQDEIASATLTQLQDAVGMGVALVNGGPLQQGSVALTDAIIFKGIASELGHFPLELVRQVVSFYTYALEIGRLVTLGASMEVSLRQLQTSVPRFRMKGGIVLKYLELFAASGYDPNVSLRIDARDLAEMAEHVKYPLGEVMKERGLVPPQPNEESPSK